MKSPLKMTRTQEIYFMCWGRKIGSFCVPAGHTVEGVFVSVQITCRPTRNRLITCKLLAVIKGPG